MPRHTDFSAERSRPNKIGSERLQGLVTTASLSFWLPGCLSKLSCNQNQRLGYSALIKAVHKADFPLYNSDIHLSFAGLISGGADGQESDEPQGSVSKENHNDHKYNLGRTGKYRYRSRREECDMERMIDAETEELSKRDKYGAVRSMMLSQKSLSLLACQTLTGRASIRVWIQIFMSNSAITETLASSETSVAYEPR